MRIGQELTDTGKPTESGFGVGEQRHEASRQLKGPRQRRREVRDVGVRPDGLPRFTENGPWEVSALHERRLGDPNEKRSTR